MALSALTRRVYEVPSEFRDWPVKASAVIYLGSALGRTAGYVRPLTAGDEFVGFAEESVTGTAVDGAVRVTARVRGVVKLAITSIAITDMSKKVYASDDGTFTLTQSTNSPIGNAKDFVSTGLAMVSFNAISGSGLLTGITVLTAASGTGDNTVADVGSSFSQTTLNNNFQDIASKINEIIAYLK